MFDLNRTERRALAASVFLVGLGSLTRILWSPAAADVEWIALDAGGAAGPQREAVAEAVAQEARARTPLADGERVDVSTAGTIELRRLPGVGPSLAEAIVRERTSRPFGSVSDLERVPGIGPATLTRLAERITVSASPIDPSVGAASPAGSERSGCAAERIDPNTADATELETLSGVGPALAARILQHREENGPFARPEDLEAVSGIGPARVASLSAELCFR